MDQCLNIVSTLTINLSIMLIIPLQKTWKSVYQFNFTKCVRVLCEYVCHSLTNAGSVSLCFCSINRLAFFTANFSIGIDLPAIRCFNFGTSLQISKLLNNHNLLFSLTSSVQFCCCHGCTCYDIIHVHLTWIHYCCFAI